MSEGKEKHEDMKEQIEDNNENTEKTSDGIKKLQEENSELKDKWQRALADYQNLERRNTIEISQKILQKTNQLMLGFIGIYEDFVRAKISLVNDNSNTGGLDVVIKNMENS